MNLYPECIFVAAIITNLFYTAFAIRCYDCNTMENPDCFTDFKNSAIDCDFVEPTSFHTDPQKLNVKANSCMKLDLKLGRLGSGDSHPAIFRSCNWDFLTYDIDPSIQFLEYSRTYCYDGLCNSSTVTGPFAATVALFIVLARMLS